MITPKIKISTVSLPMNKTFSESVLRQRLKKKSTGTNCLWQIAQGVKGKAAAILTAAPDDTDFRVFSSKVRDPIEMLKLF